MLADQLTRREPDHSEPDDDADDDTEEDLDFYCPHTQPDLTAPAPTAESSESRTPMGMKRLRFRTSPDRFYQFQLTPPRPPRTGHRKPSTWGLPPLVARPAPPLPRFTNHAEPSGFSWLVLLQ